MTARFTQLLLVLLLAAVLPAAAQELNCNVVINSDAVDNVDKRVFADMKKAVQDFMNLRKWTNDNYTAEERIKCNILITITKPVSGTEFEAKAQIQSARPVFGTDYESIMLNYLDEDFNFTYQEGQPLEFIENGFRANLTQMLGFYAYVILGYDYDTFSKLGGRDYFQKANTVLTNASSANYKGWQAFEGTRNRYWLMENFNSQLFQPFREGLYLYHRKGLDQLVTKPEEARTQVLELLKKLQTVKNQRQVSVLMNNFMDAKSQEIVNFLKEAPPAQKQEAYNILAQLDATKTELYQTLIK